VTESIIKSLEWLSNEAGSPRTAEEALGISPEEIHAACETAAAAVGHRPGTSAFADLAGNLHFAFEWGVRWQQERERGNP